MSSLWADKGHMHMCTHPCTPTDLKEVKDKGERGCQLLQREELSEGEEEKCHHTGKAENVSQEQGWVAKTRWLRPGGHKKAVGRARDGICEVRLPRVWRGDKWLWLVDVPPQSYILACNVSLVIPNVLWLEVPGGSV